MTFGNISKPRALHRMRRAETTGRDRGRTAAVWVKYAEHRGA